MSKTLGDLWGKFVIERHGKNKRSIAFGRANPCVTIYPTGRPKVDYIEVPLFL